MAQITVTDLSTYPVVAGDDWSQQVTLSAAGSALNLTSGTVTCSIYDERDQANAIISAHSVTLTTPSTGIVTVTLTDTQTATLHYKRNDRSKGVYHILDFKFVASGGNITRPDPYRILVRGPLTA